MQVLERARTLEALGAGITLWPNAVLALRALGVELPTGAPAEPGGIRDSSGRWISRTDPASFTADILELTSAG